MPRNNSAARREQRREAADWRLLKIQTTCLCCHRRHALTRNCHTAQAS